MTDEEKRIDGNPAFETDRAWERLERRLAGEPVPAFWRQNAEDTHAVDTSIERPWVADREDNEKDGAMMMKRTEAWPTAGKAGTAGMAETAGMAGAAKGHGGHGAWRTERPAKRRMRRLTAGAAAVAAAAVLLATPLGDRAMAAMMQTFRIQHMVGVGISADDMAAISNLLDRGSPDGDRSFNLAQYGTLTQAGGGEDRAVTWAEAEQRMGSPLLRLDNAAAPVYQPGTSLTFRLNVKAVNRLLVRLGSDSALPAEADGKAIQLRIPGGISAEGDLAGKPARLLQFGKPELTVEGGIDAAAVRDAILGLPVLPDSLRTKLAAIGDWRTTLPVPVRDGAAVDLQLDGHDAVMTSDGSHRYLLWLDGDRMNLLIGETKDFPADSAFRQAAEELVRP